MEGSGFYIIIFGGILFIIDLAINVRTKAIITEGFSTIGTVTGYVNKFERVAGSWTWLDYPTVEYKDKQNKPQTGFIKYAKSTGRYFSIGAEVEMIIHSGTIYYKPSVNAVKLQWLALAIVMIGIGKLVYENWG